MRHLTAAVAALALASPVTASAHWGWTSGTAGDGHKVTQQRQVGDFKAIRLEGSLDVRVKVGAPTAVAVTIDENLQPDVLTRLEGDTLVIETRNVSYRGEGKVEISTPALSALEIEGSGDGIVEGGRGDQRLSVAGSGDLTWRGTAGRLEVSIAGSGDVRLDGTAEETTMRVAGSGDIQAKALTTRSADVQVAGSGDVDVTLGGGVLRAEVNGSGDIHWSGTAQVDRASVNGSGEIARR